jgi:uncharacterized protein (DUF1330 family)
MMFPRTNWMFSRLFASWQRLEKMMRFNSYVVTWADQAPATTSRDQIVALANAARAHSGELLALGPVHDSSEQDSRQVPSWVGIARFADDHGATAWFDGAADHLGATTILAPALPSPVWWPPELEAERPDWSRRLDLPDERLGMFVSVWADITDPGEFADYSAHFRWTLEYDGGVGLATGPSPRVLRGKRGPDAIALFGWPADEVARHFWYNGPQYRPYKQQRQRSSNCTIVSVMALGNPTNITPPLR